MTGRDPNKRFQPSEAGWALTSRGTEEESQGLLATCSPLLALCVRVHSNAFVRMCVCVEKPSVE